MSCDIRPVAARHALSEFLRPGSCIADPRELGRLRPCADEVFLQSLLVLGAPRSGKLWGTRQTFVRWHDTGAGAFVGEFPHPRENGPLVANEAAAEGHGNRIDFDSLDDPNHCLPCLAFPRSRHPDPYVRAMENADYRDNLIEQLGRNRREPIEQQTTVIELATHAIELCQSAAIENVTFEHLLAVGKLWHPKFHELLDNQPNQELVEYWNSIPKQGAVVRKDLAALWRLIEQKFGDPRILTRQISVDVLAEKLRTRRICIFEGGRSRRATRAFLGLVSMSVKQAVRDHYAMTGEKLPVLEVGDEVQSQGFTEFETHALREMPKMGLHSIYISHSPRLMRDPWDNAECLQNFFGVVVYRCGDWHTALECAYLAAGKAFDPYLEHSRHVRTIQRHAGFDVEKTITVTKSRGKSGENDTKNETEAHGQRLIPRFAFDQEHVIKYFTLDDQPKIIATRLMELGQRQRLACLPGYVGWETVSELEEPWIFPEIGKQRFADLLHEIHHRGEYRKPSLPAPVEMPSSPSSASTQGRSTKSSNGRNGHSPKNSLSAPTAALRDVLTRSGRKRDVP